MASSGFPFGAQQVVDSPAICSRPRGCSTLITSTRGLHLGMQLTHRVCGFTRELQPSAQGRDRRSTPRSPSRRLPYRKHVGNPQVLCEKLGDTVRLIFLSLSLPLSCLFSLATVRTTLILSPSFSEMLHLREVTMIKKRHGAWSLTTLPSGSPRSTWPPRSARVLLAHLHHG